MRIWIYYITVTVALATFSYYFIDIEVAKYFYTLRESQISLLFSHYIHQGLGEALKLVILIPFNYYYF